MLSIKDNALKKAQDTYVQNRLKTIFEKNFRRSSVSFSDLDNVVAQKQVFNIFDSKEYSTLQ